jgi:hypothetical protein
MSNWNLGQSIIVSASSSAGRPVTADWQRWIAENLLQRLDPRVIVETLLQNGFDRDTALEEVRAALSHPYLQAALAAKPVPEVRPVEKPQRPSQPQAARTDTSSKSPFEIIIYQIADDGTLKKNRRDGTGWDWGWAERRRQWMDDTPAHHAYRCLPLTILNQTGFWINNPVGFTAVWRGSNDPGTIDFTFDAAGDFWSRWINSQFGMGIITWNTPFLFRTNPPGSRLLVSGPANYFKENLHPLMALIESDWIRMSFTMNYKVMRPNQPVRYDQGEPLFQAIPLASNVCADIEEAVVNYCRLADDPDVNRSYLEWQASRNQFHKQKAAGEVRPDGWQKDYFHGQDATGREVAPDHRTKVTPPKIHFTQGTVGNAPKGLA